jgi:predicted acylesterase/phospholipase RssA
MGHRAALDAGRQPTDPIRILSLDGGGMRGLMCVRILVELERLSGRRIAELFDVIAGTSTGGMIALGLTRPGPEGKPGLTAQEVQDIYIRFGSTIFPRVAVRPLRPLRWEKVRTARPVVTQRVGALARPSRYSNARYSAAGLEKLLAELLGTTRLAEAMADVIIPSYDWKAGRAFVFRSREARDGTSFDPTMAQVARATTAAPTYFPPMQLRTGDRELVLIDGGVVANNPASIAYFEALYNADSERNPDPDFLVLSLGTGRPPVETPTYQELWSRNWLRMGMGMLGVMMDGTSEISDEVLGNIMRPRHPRSRYWRIDTDLYGVRLNLDDASPQQVKGLIGLAEKTIADHMAELTEMAGLLTATGVTAAAGPPDQGPGASA